MTEREFESLLGHFLAIRRHAVPAAGRDHDWQHVVSNAAVNNDFARFESWISRCLLEERIISAREFEDLGRAAAKAAREYVA
jgi:adenylate cyclase